MAPDQTHQERCMHASPVTHNRWCCTCRIYTLHLTMLVPLLLPIHMQPLPLLLLYNLLT
jgi:hypothetical protein